MVSLELEARLDNLLATAQEETKDVDLFAPIPKTEECPICLVLLPINEGGGHNTSFHTCCGKTICDGCTYQEVLSCMENGESPNEHKCAFCRQPQPKNYIKSLKKLMKKNNPDAFMDMAFRYKEGDEVIQSETKALEMYIYAAELGHTEAFGYIGQYYERDIGVEQDISKALEFYEMGAKKGSIGSHKELARFYGTNGDMMKGIKHLKVTARAGDKKSMDALMIFYKKKKLLSKEELSQTLRVFQASSDEMKSEDRNASSFIQSLVDQTGS